jgi:hypothetical protein
MIHRIVKFALAWALTAACAAPGDASAQFFIRVDGTVGPPTCTNTQADGTGTGTFSFLLPPSNPNAIFTVSVNGTPLPPQFFFFPSPGTQPFGGYTITFPSTPFPFTVVAEEGPAANGAPVGDSVRLTINCPAAGPGTAFIQNISGGSSVPASSPEGLVALSVMLALAAMLGLRRRGA